MTSLTERMAAIKAKGINPMTGAKELTLLQAVTKLGKLINKSDAKAMPIYGMVQMRQGNGRLILTTSNGEAWLKTDVSNEPAWYHGDDCCVEVDRLKAALKGLGKQEFRATVRDGMMNIGNDDTVSLLPARDSGDMPPAPSSDYTVKRETTKAEMQWLAVAAARDYSRPVLSGIMMAENVKAASDGFRLRVTSGLEAGGEQFIFPAGMVKFLPTDTKAIHFRPDWTGCMSYDGETTMYCKPIVGTFPNFHSLIPSSSNGMLEVYADTFRDAVLAVQDVAKQGSSIVRMESNSPSGGDKTAHLLVTSRYEAAEGETNSKAAVPIMDITGDDIRIAFNCQYLKDMAAEMTNKVRMCYSGPSNQATFYDVGRETDGHARLEVIMPMFVQW